MTDSRCILMEPFEMNNPLRNYLENRGVPIDGFVSEKPLLGAQAIQ